MLKWIIPLTVAACLGLLIQPEASSGQDKIQSTIAHIDFGKVLHAATGIHAYKQAKDGSMVVADLSDEEVEKLAECLSATNDVIRKIMEDYNISIVLRTESQNEPSDEQVFSFYYGATRAVIAQPSKVDKLRKQLLHNLNKRIVAHRKTDISSMVISELKKGQMKARKKHPTR